MQILLASLKPFSWFLSLSLPNVFSLIYFSKSISRYYGRFVGKRKVLVNFLILNHRPISANTLPGQGAAIYFLVNAQTPFANSVVRIFPFGEAQDQQRIYLKDI